MLETLNSFKERFFLYVSLGLMTISTPNNLRLHPYVLPYVSESYPLSHFVKSVDYECVRGYHRDQKTYLHVRLTKYFCHLDDKPKVSYLILAFWVFAWGVTNDVL